MDLLEPQEVREGEGEEDRGGGEAGDIFVGCDAAFDGLDVGGKVIGGGSGGSGRRNGRPKVVRPPGESL
eukprot:14043249-Ditylum_brightwellii.AAC.1